MMHMDEKNKVLVDPYATSPNIWSPKSLVCFKPVFYKKSLGQNW